ncbi:MAG: polysaccharide deacetylase family protein [Sulfurimonas sp.]|nr:polysaccharide deacetylase family protein [Sulfurimonas sp.]
MNIFITLDYEMFFGSKLGNLKTSIIKPTEQLLRVADKNNVKMTFFVDIGYVIKLKQYKVQHTALEEDYNLIAEQVKTLASYGHDVQLHIHPHWEDSSFDGSQWNMITHRYRLHDFSEDEIKDIIYRYKKALEELTGQKIFTYRAGGWCIQPFFKIKQALQDNELWLDSTLFNNGRAQGNTHSYNFKNMPKKSQYRFENDPLEEVKNGYFLEVPISSYKVSPLLYLKTYFFKKFGEKKYNIYGDGIGLSSGSLWDKLKILTYPIAMPVSIDGYKSTLLQKALDSFQNLHQEKEENFVIIGHNKLLSDFSLENLERFIQNNKVHNFTVYSNEFSNLKKEHGKKN